MKDPLTRILDAAADIYPGTAGDTFRTGVERLLAGRRPRRAGQGGRAPGPLTQRDAVLITYPDQVTEQGQAPLRTLNRFVTGRAAGLFTFLHLLPFYPSTSDDGFSVSDYAVVDPALGDWSDIAALARRFGLMVDLVLNHASRHSAAFQRFLDDDPEYRDFFLTADPSADLSAVARPRSSPLLTPVATRRGIRHVWTTFSADQVDLNYANPRVLVDMMGVLLEYVNRGATIIRLDAVAYLWKQIGTACINLPQTHAVVRLLRALVDLEAPGALLITETNVPHQENVRYFGSGDEAHLVYQFSLSPLVYHAFLRGDSTHLSRWAASLEAPPAGAAYFNFLASHDGIGLRPLEGILPPSEIQALVDATLGHGGLVSLKSNAGGGQSPYELNISYFDALSDPHAGEPQEIQVRRFLTAHAILLSLAGLPAVYVHSLLGSRSWRQGVSACGQNRAINRQKFPLADLEADLTREGSLRSQVYHGLRRLLEARGSEPAFHPAGGQQVIAANPSLFCLVRTAPDGGSRVLCLHNVTAEPAEFVADVRGAGLQAALPLTDLLTQATCLAEESAVTRIRVPAWGVLWLRQG